MESFNEIGLRYASGSLVKRFLSAGKRLALLHRSALLHHVEITGTFHGESGERALVYIGEGESLPYFKGLCFSNIVSLKESKCWLYQLAKERQIHPGTAIVVVEVNRVLFMVLKGSGYLGYPWVLQKVLTTSSGYLNRKAHILKRRGIRVRKRQYRYDTTTDESAILTFYRQFYRPYIRGRFGAMAHLRHSNEFLVARDHGMLLRVFDGDQWVAGMVCLKSKTEVASIGIAVSPDNPDQLRRGALMAAYYFLFHWAEDEQVKTVNLFRSRPHGDDGVFHHKAQWGADVYRDPWPHTCYTISIPPGQPVPAVLRNQLVWDGSGFVSLESAAGVVGSLPVFRSLRDGRWLERLLPWL